MKKRVFVTGSAGLVASRFIELQRGNFNIHASEVSELDLTKGKKVRKYFQRHQYDVVINFAAWTDVGFAEKQRGNKSELCWQVNVNGVSNLVNSLDPGKTHFIHISTDMVFPGSKNNPGPYLENHQVDYDSKNLTWYGYTKALAEKLVLEKLKKKVTILRLIYPVRAHFEKKLDFIKKPLSLYKEGKLYPLFNDQQISITFIDEASTALEQITKQEKYGIFHASSPDTTTPHELVSYLVKRLKLKGKKIESSSLDQFVAKGNNPRRYPKFGGLSVVETEKMLDFKFSSWKQIVEQLISQGLE